MKTPQINTPTNTAIGLDIGTTKICAFVLSKAEDSDVYKVVGFSSVPSTGVRRGSINNLQKTTDAIRQVISDVQQKTGIQVNSVMVGIAGDHIEAMSASTTVAITGPNSIVTEDDVERAKEDLRKSKIFNNRSIIHIVPYEFILDDQDGVIQPVGMCASRMQANVHIVTGLKTAIQNMYLCVQSIPGLTIQGIILEPLASSLALLSEDEKEVGVCLIDIGGGTTDITIFKDNVLRFTSEVAIGGQNITKDINKYYGITEKEAERIKCEYGHTYLPSILKKNEPIMIKAVGGSKPIETTRDTLCELIQFRMEEILTMCYKEVQKSGLLDDLRGVGVVLTGGTSQVGGLVDLASQIFRLPVRIGYPERDKYNGLSTEIESPVYSTAVGLALRSLEQANQNEMEYSSVKVAQNDNADNADENDMDAIEEHTNSSMPAWMQKISALLSGL